MLKAMLAGEEHEKQWGATLERRQRRELYEAYAWFWAAYREAAERLKAGHHLVAFPPGSFPPGLPFVKV